jgi:flavorubredoxin
MNKLTQHVFITSVLNPSMRIFDVTMRTEYGTSYNSYVVKGSKKCALIDAAHASFADYHFDNIAAILGDTPPDYLILNHCEPDHSGSVAALLERYPNITIVVSKAGSLYLKNITNRSDYQLLTPKDGETLSLGDIELRFIMAPFLHWPDSMFTWLEADGVLFTCDFLGAHFCEPQLLDCKIMDTEDYRIAVKEYYEAIMSPFASYVRAGLDKMADLNVKFAANSHGPVLSSGVMLEWVLEQYRAWSAQHPHKHLHVPVFYASAYGNTQRLAKNIAHGILEIIPDAEVSCYDITQHDLEFLSQELNQSDAFLVGSVTINKDAVPPIWHLLANIESIGIAKRPCATFGSYGWSGEAAGHLAERLASCKAAVYEQQFRVQFVPTEEDLLAAREFGKNFANTLS